MNRSMKHAYRWQVAALGVAAMLVSGCRASHEAPLARSGPSQVEAIAGTAVSRVMLTEQAVKRLDIQTAAVRMEDIKGGRRSVVPYGAVIYDVEGEAWVYTNPTALTFVRAGIDVDSIEGDLVVLSEGPPVGTLVVTVGGAELYGAEFEFQEA